MELTKEEIEKVRQYGHERWDAEDYEPMTTCAHIVGQATKWGWKYRPLPNQIPILKHLGIEIIDD
jgi:hypothetical protein